MMGWFGDDVRDPNGNKVVPLHAPRVVQQPSPADLRCALIETALWDHDRAALQIIDAIMLAAPHLARPGSRLTTAIERFHKHRSVLFAVAPPQPPGAA